MEDFGLIFVFSILGVMILASFYLPSKTFLYATVSSPTKRRMFWYLVTVVVSIFGVFTIALTTESVFLLLEKPIVELTAQMAIYLLAVVAEAIGNLICVKLLYGGVEKYIDTVNEHELYRYIADADEDNEDYDDDVDDNKIIDISELRKGRRW